MLRAPVQAGRAHLRHADVLGPRDRLVLFVAQLAQLEMRADALETVILDDLTRLLSVREAGELAIGRRAQFQIPHSEIRQILAKARQIAIFDPLAMRIGLASDRNAHRIGAESTHTGGDQTGGGRAGCGLPKKLPSRNGRHKFLLKRAAASPHPGIFRPGRPDRP